MMKLDFQTFAVALAFLPLKASAASFEVSTAAWRLQNYVGSTVSVFYTPPTCTSGGIILPANANEEERNRFYTMVLSAKLANRPMGVFYTVVGSKCIIDSYYLP